MKFKRFFLVLIDFLPLDWSVLYLRMLYIQPIQPPTTDNTIQPINPILSEKFVKLPGIVDS